MKRWICVLLSAALLLACCACAGKNESAGGSVRHVAIEVEGYGTMTLELYADQCPITVENFITLAKDGYFNGKTFHRMQDGFVLQGGALYTNGMGGSDKTIKGEFLANGVNNTLVHSKGVISMARSNDYNSASSQFFLVLNDSAASSLDGLYAGFGRITEGMDVLDAIVKGVAPYAVDSFGTLPEQYQPMIKTVKVLD